MPSGGSSRSTSQAWRHLTINSFFLFFNSLFYVYDRHYRLYIRHPMRFVSVGQREVANLSLDFQQAVKNYRGIPSNILPGRYRGNLTAIVVLLRLDELQLFFRHNRPFLLQVWHDTLFILE
jgi:hypothetical protein